MQFSSSKLAILFGALPIVCGTLSSDTFFQLNKTIITSFYVVCNAVVSNDTCLRQIK